MPRRRVKKQQRLQGDGFWDTLTSWGRTLRDYPKLIADGPVATPQGSVSSSGLPDKSILKDIADNSYKGTSDDMKDIPGFTLKLKTPTLVIYQKDGDNVMVIGVRGTADFRDFRAWFSTAFNVIPDSERFQEDIAEVSKFQQQYPLSAYTYYATGHSLGGTLIDELIKKGMVKEARTYNPAIETDDIPNVALSQKNHRIYADGDPLYLLQGRYDNPTEVRKSYKYYPSSAYDFVPGYDKYKQHVLANPVFVGGADDERRSSRQPPGRSLDGDDSDIGDDISEVSTEDERTIDVAGPAGERAEALIQRRGRRIDQWVPMVIEERQRLRSFPEPMRPIVEIIIQILEHLADLLVDCPSQDFDRVLSALIRSINLTLLLSPLSTEDQLMSVLEQIVQMAEDVRRASLTGREQRREDREAAAEEEDDDEDAGDASAAGAVGHGQIENNRVMRANFGMKQPNDPDYLKDMEERMKYQPNPFFHLQGAGMMANSQFYRTDPKRNPLLRGGLSHLDELLGPREIMDEAWHKKQAKEYNDRQKGYYDGYVSGRNIFTGSGIWDDVKKGIEGVYGKAPISAHHVWTPAEQADINRRQRITDVDKQRAKMVSSRVDYAYKNIMDNAQHKNVLQGYFKSVGTDNVKDYVAKVRELANKAAEEFYPY